MEWLVRRIGVGSLLALVLAGCGPEDGRAAEPGARACVSARHARRTVAAVRWRTAAPPADGSVLARWCATVGVPVYVATPAAGAANAASDTLVVVSWNVHIGGGDVPRLVRDLRAGRLTDGRPVRQFVLLLQESYRAGADLPRDPPRDAVPHRIAPSPPEDPRIDVVTTARELGLALLYVPSMRNGMEAAADSVAEDRGNAILSTLPLSDPTALELPFESQRHVPVLATVRGRNGRGDEWRLRVASVHLDHRASWRRALASFGAARTQQARALAAALAREPVLAVGADLNTWSLSALEGAVRYLRAQFQGTPPEPRKGTFEWGLGVTRRLDHMFFRLPPGWRVAVARVNDRYGSDHFPLLARIVMVAERPEHGLARGARACGPPAAARAGVAPGYAACP